MTITKQLKNITIAGGATLALVLATAMPAIQVQAASDAKNTTISATVGPMITMTATPTVTLNATPTDATGVEVSAPATVTVSTNNSSGYKLSIKAAETDLKSGANTIPAAAAGPAAFGNNEWGYQVSTTANTSGWSGVTTSDVQLKTTNATATNDETTVQFGMKVNSSQPSGTYTGTVTFTAVTN